MDANSIHTTQTCFILFKEGDEKAFAHYFNLFYKPLQYYAYRLLKDTELAEDITADTFIKLFERRERFKDENAIKGFLYTTVKNACLDKLIQLKVHARHHNQIKHLQPQSGNFTFEELIRAETLGIIYKAMESIPPATRRVFKMFYIEGKDYAEISKELNRSKETIRRQKRQALEALKQKLFPLSLFIFLFTASVCAYFG